jgi:hypothetical protein
LAECHTGTISTPSSTTFVDESLIDYGGSGDEKLLGAWVLVTSGTQLGTLRRVSTYNDKTGQVTLSRAWTPPTSASYELHTKLSPADLKRCINAGLGRCFYLDRQEITAVDGQREYSLAAYTWLTETKQLAQVLWKQGDTDNEHRYLPLSWWQLSADAGALTLHVDPMTIMSGSAYVLVALRPYAALATDAATTDCPLDWAKAAAMVEVYRLISRNDPAMDATRLKGWQAEVTAVLFEKDRRYMPRPVTYVRLPDGARRGVDSRIVR